MISMRRVAVLVLGDVGRSPRMQYHALSLARSPEVAHVTLIGYAGSRCVPEVEALIDSGRISLRLLREDLLPRPRSKVAYLVYAPAKALLKLGQLLFALLLLLPRVDVLLLQTPPAIPTLAAAWLARAASGCMVVVDWHNLGFSVLEHGGLGASHPYVLAARLYEALLGWSLDGHLCVTAAMSGWLREHWSVRAATLYDRPPAFFCPTPLEQRHELLRRLRPALVAPGGAPLWEEKPPSSSPRSSPWDAGGTPWTSLDSGTGQVRARPDAPALLVSSTSWSADEDFGVLLDALLLLDASLSSAPPACGGPRVLVAITGKGPLKQHYERRVAGLALRRIGIATLWLEPADYPVLLGCADLGVCLHGSTSGLDLPMKVLDMLGCGLPVCAVGFDCLSELVIDGTNGLIFRDARQLASQLLRLLAPTKEAAAALAALRAGVAASEAKRPRWAENWSEVAAPVLLPRGAGPQAATRKLMCLGTLALLVALFGACLLRGLVWMERRGWLDFTFDESEVLVPNWVEWLL
mmetsp:Transcript_48416/g.152178  ORF Transcript_48416/g.152178 Transcript_48416/m.152178 type:complete len:523 (+) Transcript_48416:27-1595(+)